MNRIRRLLLSLWRRRLLTVAAVVIVAGSTIVLMWGSQPRYAAESMLRFEQEALGVGQGLTALTASQRPAQTYARIIAGRSFAERVVADLGGEYSVNEVMGSLSARQVDDLDLLMIRAENAGADRAAAIANSAAAALKEYVREIESDSGRETVAVVDSAVAPAEPFAPMVFPTLIVAILVGLLLGILMSLVFELAQDRFFEEKELESHTGVPILGSIPVLARRRA